MFSSLSVPGIRANANFYQLQFLSRDIQDLIAAVSSLQIYPGKPANNNNKHRHLSKPISRLIPTVNHANDNGTWRTATTMWECLVVCGASFYNNSDIRVFQLRSRCD